MESFAPVVAAPGPTPAPTPRAPGLAPHPALVLQRRVGNRATLQLRARRSGDHVDEDHPIQREVDRVARQVGAEGGEVDGQTASAVERARTGGSPLDDDVRRRMETGFGRDLSDIRVHTDGEADTLSRTLQATAFTTGSDIFFSAGSYRPGSAGGDELLAHELAHTVQQGSPVRRLFAGVEYTEQLGAMNRYRQRAAGAGPARIRDVLATEPAEISYIGLPATELGANVNVDRDLARQGRVRLTNDVTSAEWILEEHGADLDVEGLIDNVRLDFAQITRMRTGIESNRRTAEGIAAAEGVVNPKVALVPGNVANLGAAPADPGFFVYDVRRARGAAQITVQFENKETIKRIAALNASKYLVGTKVAAGDDAKQAAGAAGIGAKWRDLTGRSSYSRAYDTLLQQLGTDSEAVVVVDRTWLTAQDVAVVKLMAVNDAMAIVMTRHGDWVGQTAEKNIQRFFPKSRRDAYVHAVAQADVPQAAFQQLRRQLSSSVERTVDFVLGSVDPAALRTEETSVELNDDGFRAIEGKVRAHQPLDDIEKVVVMTAVFGPGGGRLRTALFRSQMAYATIDGGNHEQANVLTPTRGFTAPIGTRHGAVYEMREREVPVEGDNPAAVVDALRNLLTAAIGPQGATGPPPAPPVDGAAPV